MLDLAGVAAGARVLDVAAGAGGQTLAAARRVGERRRGARHRPRSGHPRLRRARGARRRFGQRRRARDGRRRARPGCTCPFDAAICRLGLYVPPGAARPRWRACAARWVPGGRLARDRLLHGGPQRLLQRAGGTHPPARRTPGAPAPRSARSRPFSSAPLRRAGRRLSPPRASAPCGGASARRPVAGCPTAGDCLRLEQESFGALHQMLAGLDDAGRAAAWDEVATALA